MTRSSAGRSGAVGGAGRDGRPVAIRRRRPRRDSTRSSDPDPSLDKLIHPGECTALGRPACVPDDPLEEALPVPGSGMGTK